MSDARDAAVVPASWYPHGYASVRSLSKAGIRTVVAVADDRLPVTVSRFADEVVEIPHPDETAAYRDALLQLAARPAVRTIVPHRPQDPYLLANHREAFERHVDLAVPPMETLRTVCDRVRLAEAAAAAGVPVPETRRLDEVDEWTDRLIVKSRYNLVAEAFVDSLAPGDTEVVKTIEHVDVGDRPDVPALSEEMAHVPIAQEYVEGSGEYVFCALYDHGEALATFQHRQLRGNSYTGSGGVYRETVWEPELEAVGRALLDELEWHGLACIEYVEDAATGEFVLIEVNPRMWQSLPCATRAGAAFPRWYWHQVTGSRDLVEPGYEVGVGSHYLYGELEHLVSVVREDSPLVERPSLPARTAEILRSCVEVPNFDYLHLDDPRPFARVVTSTAAGAIARRL